MNGFSANSGRSSRSLWQDTIFELRRAGSLLPTELGPVDETSGLSTAGMVGYHDGVATRSSGSPVRAALSALDTFSHVLTQIDRLTHAHSERVARYAVRLAHFVGVSSDDMKRLQLGALLHDCGKIEIDPSILNKAGFADSGRVLGNQTASVARCAHSAFCSGTASRHSDCAASPRTFRW
jgi:hypothetical protein